MIYIQVENGVGVNRIIADPNFIASQSGEWMTEEAFKRFQIRSAMRVQWGNLPEWIRGPYRPEFDAANNLLDEGDDVAASSMISSIQPTQFILEDATRLATFTAVKSIFSEQVANLAP